MKRNNLLLTAFILFALTFIAGCGGKGSGNSGNQPPPSEPSPAPAPSPAPTPAPSPPPAFPDLQISDIKVEPKPTVVQGRAVLVRGTNYSFRVEVVNNGPGPMSGGIVVAVEYSCPGVGQRANISVGNGLNVGESRLSQPYVVNIPVSKPHGTCQFRFKVDPDNITKESDESELNNVWESTLTVH